MFSSPYPDVDIPDLSIYDYLFGGLGEEDLDRIAIVDGTSGAETTYRTLRGQIDALAGAVAARASECTAWRPSCAPTFRLCHGLPRPAAGRRHGDHHQLAVHGG